MPFIMLALVGCLSVRNLQTAAPLGKGQSEFGVDFGYPILMDTESGDTARPPVSFVNVNVSFRHGVSERTDLLLEGSSSAGIGFGIKGTLTNPESNSVQVALAPKVNVSHVIVASNIQASLPLLVGIPLGEHELTLGPRVDWWAGTLLSEDVAGLRSVLLGGTASLSLKLGPIHVIPEIAVTRPTFGQASAAGTSTGGNIGSDTPWWIQPNIAILARPARNK